MFVDLISTSSIDLRRANKMVFFCDYYLMHYALLLLNLTAKLHFCKTYLKQMFDRSIIEPITKILCFAIQSCTFRFQVFIIYIHSIW